LGYWAWAEGRKYGDRQAQGQVEQSYVVDYKITKSNLVEEGCKGKIII
jgi:hypothetical protein